MTTPTYPAHWPKKMPLARYQQLHYTAGGRGRSALVNDIKRGDLPGLKEGGKWYIYVLPDSSPAYGYSEHKPSTPDAPHAAVSLSGNHLADSILARLAANHGLKVTDAA